jgi:hypothetical protein
MIENIRLLLLWLKDLVNTIRVGDVGMVSITVGITIMGKICTGLIPIVAIFAGVYQLRIFRTRLKIERAKYDAACNPKEDEI